MVCPFVKRALDSRTVSAIVRAGPIEVAIQETAASVSSHRDQESGDDEQRDGASLESSFPVDTGHHEGHDREEGSQRRGRGHGGQELLMKHGPQIHQVMPKDRVCGEQYERDHEARSEPVVGRDPGEIGDEKVGGGPPDPGEHDAAPEIAELRALLRGGQAPLSSQHDDGHRPGEQEIRAKERIERPGVAHEGALDDPWPREQERGGGRAIGEPGGQDVAGDEHRGRRRRGGDRIVSNQLQKGRRNEAGPCEGDGQPEPEVGARLEPADAEDPNSHGQGARRETAVGPRFG